MRILAISGSLQARSSNSALLELAVRIADPDVQVSVFTGLAALPHFNPDLEADGGLPEVEALRSAIASADALLIACPEYGFSMPGALKNAIDWLIGSGQLERKLLAITAVVAGPERGRAGLAALRTTLGAVSAEVAFDAPLVRGPGQEEALREILRSLRRAHAEREAG